MTREQDARKTLRRAVRWSECHEEVTRKGEAQPCEKIAVAVRLDEGQPYPVCAYHAREPMVALSDLAAALLPSPPATTCVCGRAIQRPVPESGVDLEWVHVDWPHEFCEESGHLDDAGAWHDPHYATPASSPPATDGDAAADAAYRAGWAQGIADERNRAALVARDTETETRP